MRTKTNLSSWRWRLADANGNVKAAGMPELQSWAPARRFPTVIQMELLDNGVIPDPGTGENERLIQWVGHCDWEYECMFDTPPETGENIDLVLDGLDTFATVYINEQQILKSDNMFIPVRIPVKQIINARGKENRLRIVFESAYKAGAKLEGQFGERKSMMRDRRRMHVRKAQYSWGWDWGPIVVTAGPYLPVYLETYNSRIEDVYIRQKLSEDHHKAGVKIEIVASPLSLGMLQAKVTILDNSGTEVYTSTTAINSGKCHIETSILRPQLWWPNGQGSQSLYTVRVDLHGFSSSILDSYSTRFGIRTIELIQRPLKSAPGKTFMFRVNGRDIFAQGGDWIPADNLLPTITRERYFEWLELARFCHINMIRVWGGGIYETDDFFDACDEKGILVWHDYTFACGDYPVHDEFLDSIRTEAEAQTIRMRNRASLALLCGGNEDFMLCDWNGVKFDHADTTGPFENTPFPQRKIYLDILPKVAASLCPDVVYWANSPYGGSTANDTTEGDIHQWSVWHLEQLPYQEYKNISGRFVSEFGMHGFPVQRTVDFFTRGASPEEVHPQSRLIDCHNKGHGAHMRIARYLAENFRFDMTTLRNFVYSSQLLQSEAYGYALRCWKRLFNGPGDEQCAGAIIWQFNDVYPSTSWAFVDYFLRPKPAFYTIRRSFAPFSLGVDRKPSTRWVDEDKPRESDIPSFSVFAHNTTPEDSECRLVIRAHDFVSGEVMHVDSKSVVVYAGRNNEVCEVTPLDSWTSDSIVLLEVTLEDSSSGRQLARFVDWPEPYRYLYWPADTKISVKIDSVQASSKDDAEEAWENSVTISSTRPLKGVWLEPIYNGSEADSDPEPLWSDNMVDLLPEKELTVLVKGLKGRELQARFLGDWEIESGLVV